MSEEAKQNPAKPTPLVSDLAQQLNAAQQRVSAMRLQSLQYFGAYGVENPDGTSMIYNDVVQLKYGVSGWKERPEHEFTFPNALRFTLVDGKWKLLLESWSPSNLPAVTSQSAL